MKEFRNAYRILVGKLEECSRIIWKNNTKMGIKEI
jgi:hypothetical protein